MQIHPGLYWEWMTKQDIPKCYENITKFPRYCENTVNFPKCYKNIAIFWEYCKYCHRLLLACLGGPHFPPKRPSRQGTEVRGSLLLFTAFAAFTTFATFCFYCFYSCCCFTAFTVFTTFATFCFYCIYCFTAFTLLLLLLITDYKIIFTSKSICTIRPGFNLIWW